MNLGPSEHPPARWPLNRGGCTFPVHPERHGGAVKNTITLGRIAGIPVGISWSWIPVFGLLIWSLARGVFPSTNPGLGSGAYALMAGAAAVAFFGSLLLHELGHALQARRDDVEIDGIVLWLLGGVARFRGRLATAGTEFRIALAGPLVTASLAVVFLGCAWLLPLSAPADGVVAWLGYTNVLLLAFNIVPALPLDGGRMLRSALWRARGDLRWATRVCASLGFAIACLMIGAGALSSVATGSYQGVWLAIVGWFILVSARHELRLVSLQSALDGFVVSDVMSHHPIVSQADQTVRDFMAEVPAGDRSPAYPVLEGLRPVGILPSPVGSSRAREGDPTEVHVRDRMLRIDQIPLLAPDEPASEALRVMVESGTDDALVLEDGRLAGVVCAQDVEDALRVGTRRQQRGAAGRPDGNRGLRARNRSGS